jgi:hypothetical protein
MPMAQRMINKAGCFVNKANQKKQKYAITSRESCNTNHSRNHEGIAQSRLLRSHDSPQLDLSL